MLMVALSIHFCGVVTGLGSVCFDNGYTCQKVMLSQRSVCVCVCVLKKNWKQKNSPPDSEKHRTAFTPFVCFSASCPFFHTDID